MIPSEARNGLVCALIDGAFETPLWSTFLDGIREVTRADYATLIVGSPHRPFHETLQLLSSAQPSDASAMAAAYEGLSANPLAVVGFLLEEGRPYGLDEVIGGDQAEHRRLAAGYALDAVRIMRVQEPSGVDSWLTLSRQGGDFNAEDTALVASLAPIMRGVMCHFVASERERYGAALTAEGARRLDFGWLALDAAGAVLAGDANGERILAQSPVLGRNAAGRLTVRTPEAEEKLHRAVRALADRPDGRSRALNVSRDPWLDLLLVPARRGGVGAQAEWSVIAYLHADAEPSRERWEHLSDLFGLTAGEARLALALSRGATLAEAAEEFELKVDTVRGYSKAIYAKTGARGLPDLVRIVLRSAMAAPPKG